MLGHFPLSSELKVKGHHTYKASSGIVPGSQWEPLDLKSSELPLSHCAIQTIVHQFSHYFMIANYPMQLPVLFYQ